jgi:predicted dehydrogenase
VEKPLVLTTEQGEELLTLAASAERTLMVGFTFLYNGGVRKLKQYMNGGNGLGEVYYLYATRTNLGPIRRDVNAAWDLAPHDIAIFSYLLGTQPSHVSATGSSFLHSEQDDVAFITLTYPNGVVGNIHVSWANPHRVRQVAVVGSKKRLVFDDLDSVERVRVYDKGVERSGTDRDGFGDFLLSIRDGDIVSPMVEVREPLKELCLDFVRAVETSATPLASAQAGLECVRVLLAVQRSMELGGTRVQVGDR